jgi:hypothetical protein
MIIHRTTFSMLYPSCQDLRRPRCSTNLLVICQNRLSVRLNPFVGGLQRKPFILVSLEWPSTTFVFQVSVGHGVSFIVHFNYFLSHVERTFSKGRLLLSHIRNRLLVESTRALLCLNNWSKQGFVKPEYLKEAATLPEVDGEAGEESDVDMVL